MDQSEILIVGSGPAGLTAAIYAGRAGVRTVMYEQGVFGGLASTTACIENYPGFSDGISGTDLATQMYEQAIRFGTDVVNARILRLWREGDRVLARVGPERVEAACAIVATGSTPRRLGVPGEIELVGKGVSYCATCDAPLYGDRTVAVIGGGDSALQEALFAARFAARVVLVHRRAQFRAAAVLAKDVRDNPKIIMALNKAATRINGENEVESIVLEDVRTGGSETLPVDGVFIYVGFDPNVGMLGPEFKRSPSGFLLTDAKMETSVEGIFAAGDVREKSLRQVATAVGDGALAAMSAFAYLESRHKSA